MAKTKINKSVFAIPYSSAQMALTPAYVARFTRFFVICFFVFPVLMMFLPWLQNIQGKGSVVAFSPTERKQTVDAPVNGVISKWYVQEGQTVKEGDVLLEIADIDPQFADRLDSQLANTQSRLSAKQDELKSNQLQLQSYFAVRDNKIAAAQFKVDMARQKVLAATEAIASSEATLEAAKFQLTRMKRLLDDGLVSQRDQEVADRDFIVASRNFNSAKAQLESAKAEQKSAAVDIKQARADADTSIASSQGQIDGIRAEIAESEQRIVDAQINVSRQTAQRILAPRSGMVHRVPVNTQSQMISRGEVLLEIIPENSARAVALMVNGRDAPLVSAGSEVRIEFEGWPAVQVNGWPNVAIGTFKGNVSFIDASDNGKGLFRVMVVPAKGSQEWPNTRFLRQGANANGWILLNRVTIGYEIWRLLNGFPPEMPSADAPEVVNRQA